ncbi:hypothetical protein BJ322DRAFT_1058654 [Thelephora terrestris]|uniref:C2H2-type domain-containing protein n=1 Tax=Thelephora terrestris TaxID=56493 RepID=A0A9P6HHS9_9AGAM|nr:hypothetical protein BJ322DRAFT_1058654 [Thelephora terrestris]
MKKHGLLDDGTPQRCGWHGCRVTMGGRSLNRHVLMNHLDFKTSCPYCKLRLRTDHVSVHLSKRCRANPAKEVKEVKKAKRV